MGNIKGVKIEKVEIPKMERVEIPSFKFRAENYFPLVGKNLQGDLAESGLRLKEMSITPDLKQNSGVKYINLSLTETKSRTIISPKLAIATIALAGAVGVVLKNHEIAHWVMGQLKDMQGVLSLSLLPIFGMAVGDGIKPEMRLVLSNSFNGGRHLSRIKMFLAIFGVIFQKSLPVIVRTFNSFQGSHSYESKMVLTMTALTTKQSTRLLNAEFSRNASEGMEGESSESLAVLLAAAKIGKITLNEARKIRENFGDGHDHESAGLLTLVVLVTGISPQVLNGYYLKIKSSGFEGHGAITHSLMGVAALVRKKSNEEILDIYKQFRDLDLQDVAAAVLTLGHSIFPRMDLNKILSNYLGLELVPGMGLKNAQSQKKKK